jgi:hypothetical protein
LIKGIETLHRHGLTVCQKTLSLKANELGKRCDDAILLWKDESVKKLQKEMCLNLLEKELKEIYYHPNLPNVTDIKQYLQTDDHENLPETTNSSISISTESICDGFETLDVEKLNLCCTNPSSTQLLLNACSELKCKGIDAACISGCFKDISQMAPDSSDILEAVCACREKVDSHLSYQIVGDNVDLEVKVRHMADDNKNKSLHYFNLVAFKDQVNGNSLADSHEKTLESIPISSFLPSHKDLDSLKRDFVVLWSRVVVKHIEYFSCFKKCVIYHIPHQYSDVMVNPVEEVILR